MTAFVDDMKFEQPVRVGEVVRLDARVTATFRTSMEIEVVVEGEDATSGRRWPCVDARVTFVAIDESRKPTEIPARARLRRGPRIAGGRRGATRGPPGPGQPEIGPAIASRGDHLGKAEVYDRARDVLSGAATLH